MEWIKIDDLCITSLKLNNVYDLRDWAGYEDPLFTDYNFPELDDYEIRQWFRNRVEQSTSKNYAVINNQNKTIGLIHIKNIRKILKVANLGIVFDSKFVNKGYGTRSLQAVIRYFFETMNMRTLYLDVAKHNKRAIRCYEKCGFKKVKTYTIKLNNLKIDDLYISKEDFIVQDETVHIYCYKMKLSKNNYYQQIEK